MNIYLTEDTADFGTRLRKEFMCGSRIKRYSPQTKTPFNALIADFGTNGEYRSLLESEPKMAHFRVTGSSYSLSDDSVYHKHLEKIANFIRGTTPNKTDEQEYRRFLETALEKIVISYSAEKDWLQTRQIVKSFIVRDSFKKEKELVAFDMPLEVWRMFSAKIQSEDEDAILEAMDAHIIGFCGIGDSRLREFFSEKEAEIATAKAELHSCEARFVVLNLGKPVKDLLNAILIKSFEPYLVTMLRTELPRSHQSRKAR